MDHVINIDETGVCCESTTSKTICYDSEEENEGRNAIKYPATKSVNKGKESLTVVLACSWTGVKLPAVLIFPDKGVKKLDRQVISAQLNREEALISEEKEKAFKGLESIVNNIVTNNFDAYTDSEQEFDWEQEFSKSTILNINNDYENYFEIAISKNEIDDNDVPDGFDVSSEESNHSESIEEDDERELRSVGVDLLDYHIISSE